MTLSTLTRILRKPSLELSVLAVGTFGIAFASACQL